MDFIIDLDKLVSGEVKDSSVRNIIRYGLKAQLKNMDNNNSEMRLLKHMDLVRQLRTGPIAIETDAANQQHYEVATDFYLKALDERLKYSCCYWPDGCNSLNEAAKYSLQQIVDRARLENGHKILELGCGWGSLSIYMAEKFPDSTIISISNSSTQKDYIDTQIALKGIKNLTVITCDINEFNTQESFDRVVSIEMFEHMRNFEHLFEQISSWLNPSGLLFVHIFTHKHHAYLYEKEDNWVSEFFFSGGLMPSDSLLLYFQRNLSIIDHWNIKGTHYQKTAEAWLQNIDNSKQEILDFFRKDLNEELAQKQFVMWRLFFIVVAESWGFSEGEEWMVSHYLFQKTPN